MLRLRLKHLWVFIYIYIILYHFLKNFFSFYEQPPKCRIHKPQMYSGQVVGQLWDWLKPYQIWSVLSLYGVWVCVSVSVSVCVGLWRVFVHHFIHSGENDCGGIIIGGGDSEARLVVGLLFFATGEWNCPNWRWMFRSCADTCVLTGASVHVDMNAFLFFVFLTVE